jgi:hypothetical protein
LTSNAIGGRSKTKHCPFDGVEYNDCSYSYMSNTSTGKPSAV